MNGFIKLLPFILGVLLMTACSTDGSRMDTAEINALPEKLSGMHVSGGRIRGLKLHNAAIRGMVMSNVDAWESEFSNITFENCTFSDVDFAHSVFENVAFINCTLQPSGLPVRDNLTGFEFATMRDVLFDGGKLDRVSFGLLAGDNSFVYFRNLHEAMAEGDIIGGSHMRLRVENCTLEGNLDAYQENSSIWMKNVTMKRGNVSGQKVYLENCSLPTRGKIGGDTLVIKGSNLPLVELTASEQIYLVNNLYPNPEGEAKVINSIVKTKRYHTSIIRPLERVLVYIEHGDPQPAFLTFARGNISVRGMNLFAPEVSNPRTQDKVIHYLNFRDVSIQGGGAWHNLDMQGGQWENVSIEPAIAVSNTTIQNIKAYNLRFPKGDPWDRQGDFTFEYTESPSPFEWPEVHVPTPEELGLEWWTATPGYDPAQKAQ